MATVIPPRTTTHIGDATSLTTLHAGDTLHLKGAQVLGEQVQIQTPNLTIQSVQDTATYEGKQQAMGGQITVGYEVSGSAHFNRSSMKADYASVTEQSGIYAGDGGYQIAVDKHTDLKGGLITSTAQAEQQGKNRLTTGTLSASDIANHANVEGSSLGLSGSADIKGGWHGRTQTKEGTPTHTASSGIGYGSESNTQDSTTYSGINTKQLTITDAEQQRRLTGLTPQETADRLFTATTTDTAQALSGALENRFDAQALQKELDTQREVSETFSRNVQSARAELNQAADRLKDDYKRGVLSEADYQAKREQLENGSLLLGTIAAGLTVPTNSVLGMTTASLSPSLAHQIGQYFKANGDKGGSGERSAPHLLAHGLLAAAVAVTGGNNALTAAGSAMSAEAAAPLLAQYLYGKEANALTVDEQATILSISNLVGAGVGATTGTNANIVQGGQVAGNALAHNYLTQVSVQRLKDCLTGLTCNNDSEKAAKVEQSEQLSQFLDQELVQVCAVAPTGDACRTGVHTAIQYIAMRDAWAYIQGDVERSSKETFDFLYNNPNSNKNFVHYMNTIDTRADFFGASDQYEQYIGSGAKWFGGAEHVSRAPVTGLGADGSASYITFAMGKLLGNPPLYEWRKAAGDALIVGGFENFKDLYNNKQDPVAWDIKQLKSEQDLLQPIHEKYLGDYEVFRWAAGITTEVDILNYKSRVQYGCKLLGYGKSQGCLP